MAFEANIFCSSYSSVYVHAYATIFAPGACLDVKRTKLFLVNGISILEPTANFEQ